ncbi:hypothetical protein [Elioraea thermophila]|uniref:hypothetical protein n=1 Tax=Elioraea thermophila TaxID=2185104 RepID=UPI000DF1DD1E|nr:hypothetical protein [Elioraea thermophila]
MTASVPPSARRNQYVATAGQTEFPFTFLVYAAEDLAVERRRHTTVTALVAGVDFAVSGLGVPTGGMVVLVDAAQAGDVITISSRQVSARTTAYTPSGPFPAEALNRELNRLWIAIQQLEQELARQIRPPLSDPAGLSYALPLASQRAGRLLAFDAEGQPVVATGASIEGVSVSAYGAELIGSADAAAARGRLEVAPSTAVVLRDGSQAMTGRLHIAPGAEGGLAFAGDADTGMVQTSADVVELRTGGSPKLTLWNTGLQAHEPLSVPAATAHHHAMRWGQREAEVFHIATISEPVQAVIVPLPPVPYAVAVEWHDIRLAPAVTLAGNRFFGCDYSTDGGASWVTHGWSRQYSNWFNSHGGSAWNTNEIAWALTHVTNYDGRAQSSGTLWLSRLSSTDVRNSGHYVSTATFIDTSSPNTIGGHGIVGPHPVPHPTEPPITHLRFRWRGNLTMVSGVVRVLAKRLGA